MNNFISFLFIVQLLGIEFVYFTKKLPGADALVLHANYHAVCKLGCRVQIRVPCANERRFLPSECPPFDFDC